MAIIRWGIHMSLERGQKHNGYYRSLTRNMVLIIILVSLTPMFLVSGMILYQFHSSYSEKVYDHLAEVVQKHKQNIDGFLKEKLADIRFLAQTFSFDQLRDESFLKERLALLQEEFGPVFVDLGVVNRRGLQVAYAGPFQLGKALYSDASWFKEAMGSRYFISDVFLGLRGLPHFIVAVRDNWKGEPWILRATIDFVAFNSLVKNIRIGETGFAYILNRKGKFQTTPFFDFKPRKQPYRNFLNIREEDKKKVHIVEKEGDTGTKNIYVAAFLKDGDWLLVYQQDAADAFSKLNRALEIAIVILVMGGLGILSTAFLLSKRMVNRIARADLEKQVMSEQVIETGKLAAVGELAAGIAHEINNPVAIMVEEAGWIEDLLEEDEFREGENLNEFRRALKQINSQGRRCKEITHKLLSFARKTDSRVKDTQVNELIEEVIRLSEQRAKYSKVSINANLEKALPIIEASQTELEQVFLNLINNAIDAMDNKGGTIRITSQSVEKDLLIEFSDNGSGIPQANLERIFDPFFTTKPVGKGTGLGLSICHGIIKKMGGEISVESTVGVGTTFRIHIPLSETKGAEGHEPSYGTGSER